MKVILSTFYNGETIAEVLLKTVYDYVDEIVIVEAYETFTGFIKPGLFFDKNRELFKPYMSKIKFIPIHLPVSKDPWVLEQFQRNAASDYIKSTEGEYIVIVGDIDEIPTIPLLINLRTINYELLNIPVYIQMSMFYYSYSWQKRYKWQRAFVVNRVAFENHDVNHYRYVYSRDRHFADAGYHLSYFMTAEEIYRKLVSFPHTEFNKPEFTSLTNIKESINSGKDLFNRGSYEDCFQTSIETLNKIKTDIKV